MEKRRDDKLCRRGFIKTLCAGCALLLGVGLAERLYAQAKVSKEKAAYQDQPKGNEECANCAHFTPPAACVVVAGEISPKGWSRYWAPQK